MSHFRARAHFGVALSVTACLAAGIMPWTVLGQEPATPPSDEDARTLELAKKTQNPIADLISLPLQNRLNFGYGAKDAPKPSSTQQYVLNVQPVVPIKVTWAPPRRSNGGSVDRGAEARRPQPAGAGDRSPGRDLPRRACLAAVAWRRGHRLPGASAVRAAGAEA